MDKSKHRFLIIGHARHGKDTAAEMMCELFGCKHRGSSEVAAETFIYDRLKGKYGYTTAHECFEDRINHRAEWYDLICEYNKEDKARLAKEVLKSASIYVGMRSNAEINECLKQGLFDVIIGVYDPRKPWESRKSFTIDVAKRADILILNNGDLDDLRAAVKTAGLGYGLKLITDNEK